MEYEFGLIYKVADDANMDELIEQLGEAGCDDALVGTGQPGRIALDFTRDASSAKNAIISALAAVKKAIPGAKLLEVTPDFVGMTDVAELLGVSRQNIQRLKQAHHSNFPTPVHEGSTVIWHLAHLLESFKGRASIRYRAGIARCRSYRDADQSREGSKAVGAPSTKGSARPGRLS